jgi:hypothetical protein
MEEMKKAYITFWSENLKVIEHSKDVGLDGSILAEWI